MTSSTSFRFCSPSLLVLGLATSLACASGSADDDGGATFGSFGNELGDGDGDGETSGDGDTEGDGDGDTSVDGDGDGDTGGDGDGDTSGDGDGDTSGDGDGDTGGDGDGDTSGDGDGDSCGNGVLDMGEECDGPNLDGETCQSQGFDEGILACAADCTLDTTGCSLISEFCGDGVVNQAEECDDADLGGQDCVSLGFLFGQVSCTIDCTFDTSACSDQTIIDLEDGMIPMGFTGGGNANWSITSVYKWEGTYGAVSGDIGDSQTSWAEVSAQFPNGGSVSFYRQISSEASWDYGRFYIDGIQQDEWSGSGSWGMVSYGVAAGQHTLRWSYEKDGSISSLNDALYVDYIVLDGGYVP